MGDGTGLQTKTWNQEKLDIVSDITSIPADKDSFDAIMCIEVFEHLKEPVLAIKEFARILKPGGFLIVTAPFCSLTHFAPYHFYTGFNKYFYEAILSENNFRIIEIEYNGNFYEYMAQEIRRINDIAREYSKDTLSKVELKASSIVLKALKRFNDKDKNSNELLAFGIHVFAEKLK